MNDCIFCKLANGVFPTNTVYEDDMFRVILDLGPASPGHMLILPKEHYANLYELPEEIVAEAMKLAKKLAIAAKKALNADGVNVVQNNEEAAGQTVMHYHLHVVPRFFGVGQFNAWEPGSAAPEELAEQAAKIAENLQ
ncbi:MAG: HIT domain-containing protein [Firmicutes bacterium]|nr:HIT domain-containing protein [Bacillota bacterium]